MVNAVDKTTELLLLIDSFPLSNMSILLGFHCIRIDIGRGRFGITDHSWVNFSKIKSI